jgi:ribosomal protein S18 acetylase RimI-like enzyme
MAATQPSVRPATHEDEPFLRDVYASTRASELALLPWSETQKRAFCDQQFDAQIADYRRIFRETEDLVIGLGATRIGRILKALTPNELILLDFAILPEHRNRGVGSALLRRMQDEARTAKVPMVLHVELHSPAVGLYRRHGFVVTGEDSLRFAMKWVHPARNGGTVPAQKNTNNEP